MNPKHIKSIARVVSVIMLLALTAGLTPGAVLPAYAAPGDTTCVSVNPGGTSGNDYSAHAVISPDGRYVVFESVATNLVSGDPNGGIFVRDLQTSQTTRIPVDGESPVISSGGRYVAFTTWVIGETSETSMSDVFVHDRQTSITTQVSVNSNEVPGNGWSDHAAISADGRYVAFGSDATNLVDGDTNGTSDIFVRDLQTGTTERVSIASDGSQSNAGSWDVSISASGSIVVFTSSATNLVSGDTNGARDIFVRDRTTGTTTRASVNSSGVEATSGASDASVSGNGRFVSFSSGSSNLMVEDSLNFGHIYVHDRQTGTTNIASVASDGYQMIGNSEESVISADGRYVAFVFDDKGDGMPIFVIEVHDRLTGSTSSVVGRYGWEAMSGSPSISADGRLITFSSGGALVSGDTNSVTDVYMKEMAYPPDLVPTVSEIGKAYDGGYPTPSLVSFRVIFSEIVSGVTVDDFMLTMGGGVSGATVTEVRRPVSSTSLGSVYYVTVNTGTGDGTLRLDLIDNDSITDISGNPLSGAGAGNGNFTAGEVYIVDKNIPAVVSSTRVDSNPATGAYVNFTVTFSEEVSGVDALDFNPYPSGSITGAAVSEVTGSGKNYNVKVSTGSGEGTLKLNVIDDDSIRDANNHPIGGDGADNGTYTHGEEYTIVNSSTPGTPSVTSSLRTDANPTVAASVNFTVTFSEAVSGVDSADFSLTTTGSLSGVLVATVSGSGNIYTVIVGTGSGAGDLRLDVVDNDSILNASNSPLGGSGAGNGNFTSGEAYTINRVVPFPTVISSLASDPDPTNATSVHFTVTFSEAVSGVDPIDFMPFVTGNISSATVASVSGSGSIYTVTINLGSGDGTVRLDVLDNDSIVNASNSPLGGPGAGNGNFMGGNLTINPTVVISILLADPNYTSADIVHFNVTFSESVSGVDASDFVIATTGVISSVAVTGVSGSGNTYVVTMSTGTGDGNLRIELIDDDSIINTAGNPLGGVGPNNGNFELGETYSIDKNAPIMLSSLRMDANPTTAASVRFIVTFSEAVTGVDGNDFALTTTNISGASIVGVEIGTSGFTFIVTVFTGSGNGTLRLDLIDNDSIVDDVNHPLGGFGAGNGNFTTGEVYTINKFSPTILNTSYRSTGSSDGWVLESSENSNLGGSRNSNAANFKLGDDAQDRQFRSVLHFPTYYLPDNAVITQAILMIKKQDVIGTDPFTTHQNISIDIRKGYFSNFNLFSFGSLQDTDYQAAADMYMVGTIQNNPVSGWYWAALDSRAFPYINLKDVTQLRLAFQLDDNDDMGDDYIRFYSGDYNAQKERPHLLIEYYVPR